jgi:hypothetical protein
MKTILTTTAVLALMTSVALADNFDNNTFKLSVNSGMLDFNTTADKSGISTFQLGVTGFEYKLGQVDAALRGAFTYNLGTNAIGLRGEYLVNWATTKAAVYGTAALEYVTYNTNLADGNFLFDPSVGVQYQLTERVSVFGEVGYTWNLSNDFSSLGGYVELGLPVTLNKAVTVTPSVVRGLGDGLEETNLSLSVAFSF